MTPTASVLDVKAVVGLSGKPVARPSCGPLTMPLAFQFGINLFVEAFEKVPSDCTNNTSDDCDRSYDYKERTNKLIH